MKFKITAIIAITLICLSNTPGWSQCEGYLFEQDPPPVVTGMSTSDPGFSILYWSWGEFPTRNGGNDRPSLLDSNDGIMLTNLEWSNAQTCRQPGEISRTAVLFESLDPEGFGRWALVNVGGTSGEGADLDALQSRLGYRSSRAHPLPVPIVENIELSGESLFVTVRWQNEPEAEAASDLFDSNGRPLSSVRGWALYIINAAEPTPRPWDWSFAPDLEGDSVSGYSTDTSATIMLPRSLWHNQSISLALALTFDGNGDASGENPLSKSVHSRYLGHPSQWVGIPPEGSEELVQLGRVALRYNGGRVFELTFEPKVEINGVHYRVSLLTEGYNPYLLESLDGGLEYYDVQIQLPVWAARRQPSLLVEMLDAANHILDSREIAGKVKDRLITQLK